MAKQSDRDKDRQKACQIDAFLESLRRYASAFRWFVDAHCGLRAEHPEAKFLLCPISAVYFATTGKAVRSSQVFAVADGEMELRFASLDIAVAADERLDQGLGKAMNMAVGIKAAA
jgi:hypothetical protein